MNSTTRFTSILTAAALTGLLLVGCTPAPLDLDIAIDPSMGATDAPTEPTTDEPTEAPAEDLVAGDVLTEEEALALNRDFRAGKRAYQLADGSWVVTTPDAPVPAEIKNEVTAEVGTAAQNATIGETRVIQGALGDAQYQTGRNFIAVFPAKGACEPFGPMIWTWAVTTADRPLIGCLSKDEAIAFAQNVIAGQSDPGRWELIIS